MFDILFATNIKKEINMTLHKFIERNNLLQYNPAILSKKEVDFSKIKKYKYIDICEFWYDESSDPNLNTWIDVEGIGYGWLWCKNNLRKHFSFLQRNVIRKRTMDLLNSIKEETKILCYEADEIYYYGFMIGSDCYFQIRISNTKELYC